MEILPLQEVIDSGTPEHIGDAIKGFSCRDSEVEMFLKQKAFEFEHRDKSRTYLIMENNILLGYFALSLKALPFKVSVSKSTIKKIDGFSKDVDAAGIILIGQFGKDRVLSKDISGGELFKLCINTVYSAQRIVGGRYVMLECRDVDKVTSFYRKWDFEVLQKDKTDKYLQMIRRL